MGDLWIKNKVEKEYVGGRTQEVFWGILRIHKYHNKGAALNMGEKRSHVVASISLLLCIGLTLIYIFSFGKAGNLLRMGLSFMLGGAYSNTYDRLKRKYVVDYVSFLVKWERFRRIVFNISDFCIMIGAVLVVIGAENSR